MCNTNVDGRQKVMFALTAIRGMGRRISNIVCLLEQYQGRLFGGTGDVNMDNLCFFFLKLNICSLYL